MGIIDYSREPKSDIAFVDMKSFYASVECVERGLDPLTTSLCVMSRADNAAGLILAASPTFKKVFGKQNVGRSYALPFNVHTRRFNAYRAKQEGWPMTPEYIHYIEYWARRTLIVPPRMDLYIRKNIEIQQIFKDFTTSQEILPYSIDEAFLDLTASLNYFVKGPHLNRREKLDLVSERIQHAIWLKTGIYATIGMSNSNPLLAKLALDNEAKTAATMRANWSYEDVEKKVWGIPKMTDFWGIGQRTETRLNKLGIFSIKDLALSNPDILKKEMGVMGVQLWFHAHGVDESNVHIPYRPQSKGLGNSQVLPRDYHRQSDIELVISEMAEQVAIRLRNHQKKTTCVAIYVGFSRLEEKRGIQVQRNIDPTHNTKVLTQVVLSLFREKYHGGAVRQIGVRYEGLVDNQISLISLFEDLDQVDRADRLQATVDSLRQKFGFLSVQNANVLMAGSRNRERSLLIGGHSAGGLDGLK